MITTWAAAAPSKPNVLFLVCDDLNCDLGCYGHAAVQSPNIDRLAARGMVFENAYCQLPLCGPSRASFMTGLYPDETGIHRNAQYVRQNLPRVQTLPQVFRSAGYFAARIGKIYHYSVPGHIGTAGHDDPYSWDLTINPRGRDKDEESKVVTLEPGKYGGTLSWLAADGTDEEQTDGIAATEAARLLKQYADDGRPFFLAVGLFRPHTPYVSPRRYFEHYPTGQITPPSVPEGYLDTLPDGARFTLTRKRAQQNLPIDTAKQVIQAYYASIEFADAQIGRILEALESTGLSDNTIVVVTSDHGYHMGEHGHWQKTTLFENAARVPLIIADPRAGGGGRTESLAELVDLYPTLAERCGLRPRGKPSGVSLAPVLEDPSAAPRESALTQYAGGYSLRTARYRYTEWSAGGAELYDHTSDPQEMENLAERPEHAELIDRLSAQLRRRIGPHEVELFDGETLSGWTRADGRPIKGGWRVDDGMLHLDPSAGRAGHIVTERTFGDFELTFEWKIAARGNSGLKYRVRDYNGRLLGCEYQIIDSRGGRGPTLRRLRTGALYDLLPPASDAAPKPAGEFNTSRILSANNRIEHWLNGRKALSIKVGGQAWQERVAQSKFSDKPSFGQNRYGRIMITDHGSEVWYRNLKLRVLPIFNAVP